MLYTLHKTVRLHIDGENSRLSSTVLSKIPEFKFNKRSPLALSFVDRYHGEAQKTAYDVPFALV